MKTVVSGLVVVACVLLCGCTSYRFQGHVVKVAGTSEPCAMKYRIEPVIIRVDRRGFFDGPIGEDPWAVAQATHEIREVRIRRDVMKRHPDLFTCLGKGIPLAVTVRVYGAPKDGLWSMFFPFFTTFGICPYWTGTPNPCELTVAIVGEPDISQSCAMNFRSDVRFSVFSPLGMIRPDNVPGAASCRTGNGFMKAPQFDSKCQKDWEAVFVETLADGIEVCIREIKKRTPPDVLARHANLPRARSPMRNVK